jgi:DNA-directed RNA polymerase subunit F
MKKMGFLALLLALLLAGIVCFAGCDESKDKQADKISKMSKEIGKLIAEQIKTLPPEAQDKFVEHFNRMPPEAKKQLIANLIPGGHGPMGPMHMMPPPSPDHMKMPGQGMGCGGNCQDMKNRQTQGHQMKGNNNQDQAKLNQIKNRLMNIPPEKRREAFRKFAQNNPEMAEKVKRMLQNQNQQQNAPNSRQGMKSQGNPNIQHPKNIPQRPGNKKLQKRSAPETPQERSFWDKEFLNSEGF